ncbi:MAG: hypothetical protein CMF52_02740 [Legionellales bacterium]|nr:hypothetical protein [Legionellales bacterium]
MPYTIDEQRFQPMTVASIDMLSLPLSMNKQITKIIAKAKDPATGGQPYDDTDILYFRDARFHNNLLHDMVSRNMLDPSLVILCRSIGMNEAEVTAFINRYKPVQRFGAKAVASGEHKYAHYEAKVDDFLALLDRQDQVVQDKLHALVNCKNDRQSPLEISAHGNNPALVRLLIGCGATIDKAVETAVVETRYTVDSPEQIAIQKLVGVTIEPNSSADARNRLSSGGSLSSASPVHSSDSGETTYDDSSSDSDLTDKEDFSPIKKS